MSTRGFITFVVNGEEKTTYNHSDSHPDWLGTNVLDFARGDMAAAKELAAALVLVDQDAAPTDEQKEKLKPFANLAVSTRSLDDWYCLLRNTQGYPGKILEAGYAGDGTTFPADSLFAEYGYVLDFDAGRLEAYRGFQESPHSKGRFADRESRESGYFPVALVASWSFDDLPSDEAFYAAFESEVAQ